ncbi:hypothetical protein GCM10009720_24070 [Yaniella flava]|uniref:Uncharacterized protein n=1 Tax=Yaniella flava TaxID=287930 RepID=A0ABP5GDQ8_9MICC
MNITMLLDVIGNVFILIGVVIFALAALGLFKFTDTYQRISSVGTAAGLGISLIVIGAFLLTPSWPNLVRLVVILFLQLATSSVGTMAIARSTYLTGTPMQPGYFDHLAEDQSEPENFDASDDEEDVDDATVDKSSDEAPRSLD